jgi:hypothetical protein
MVDGCVPFDLNFEEAKFSSTFYRHTHSAPGFTKMVL